jgi:hypothetical protein
MTVENEDILDTMCKRSLKMAIKIMHENDGRYSDNLSKEQESRLFLALDKILENNFETQISISSYENFKNQWIKCARTQSINNSTNTCLVSRNGCFYAIDGKYSDILEFDKEHNPGVNLTLIAEFDCGNLIN